MSEGTVTVRRDAKASEIPYLSELEDSAKSEGKGKWGPNAKVKQSYT